MKWTPYNETQPDPRYPVFMFRVGWIDKVMIQGLRSKPCASTIGLMWAHTGISREWAEK